ncbi:MAG: hypothetical protein IJ333_10100 [Clostridia bacterium]|nr:hypothetical protein [Clostridia bacterium]
MAFVGRQSQIACDENGVSINAIYPYNPDNYGVLDLYKNLYNTLLTECSAEYDVIFFAYDWRMTCANAASKLNTLLSNYDDCILIAHSMGGIVASSYLARSLYNRNKVNKFISVGTPYTGAPKALYVIETGRLMWITEALLELSEYAKNIPAIYELLPTERYFDKYSRYIEENEYNVYGYKYSLNYLKSLDWAKKINGDPKPMFSQAESFHESLLIDGTHIAERSDVDTYKIFGIDEDTITGVAYDSNGNYDFYYYTNDGDGTVPTYSALNNVEIGSDKTFSFKENHTDLIKDYDCIQLIIDIINDADYTWASSVDTIAAQNSFANVAQKMKYVDDASVYNERVTIVAKYFDNIQIKNKDGFEIYNVGEKLYYIDLTGEQHRVGSIWSLGDKSYQYVLFNDEYIVYNMSVQNSNATIRIDYCDYGLSKSTQVFNNIGLDDIICIEKQDSLTNSSKGIKLKKV